MSDFITQIPLNTLRGGSEKVRKMLKEQIEYKDSEEVYEDPQEYINFIGGEIDENANLGRQIAFMLQKQKHGDTYGMRSYNFVETCAGPGTNVRDIHIDMPDSQAWAMEWAKGMCDLGRETNPHINFIQGDVTDEFIAEKHGAEELIGNVDAMFNSASSLGFFNIEGMRDHLAVAAKLLKEGGSYFADVGYYSSNVAASQNNFHKSMGEYNGEEVQYITLTTKYHPLSDHHEICYSGWSVPEKVSDNAELLVAVRHKLRAYRFSELKLLAELNGLEARLYRMTWEFNKSFGRYVFSFELVDSPEYFVQYDNSNFIVEFHKNNTEVLSDIEFTDFDVIPE